MVATSMPKRHTGAVRTVSSSDGFKPTLSEFKLSPEQLERYRAGEKLDAILKGEKKMVLTKERYLELKSQGLADTKILKEYGFRHIGELTAWKKECLTPEEIEELRMNTLLAKRSKANKTDLSVQEAGESKTIQRDLKAENEEKPKELEAFNQQELPTGVNQINIDWKAKFEELTESYEKLVWEAEEVDAKIAGLEPENKNLSREVIDAHKLVAEKDDLIMILQKRLEQSVELYETAMLDKKELHKENTLLNNNEQALIRQRDAYKDRCERYEHEYMDLEEEINGLRRFALSKLKAEVYGTSRGKIS